MLIAAEIYGLAGLLRLKVPEIPSALCLQALGGTFGALAAVGVLCQHCLRKYRCHLVWKLQETQEIVKFAFSFGSVAKRNWYKYQEKQEKGRQETGQVGDTALHRVRDLSIVAASGTDMVASWLPG